MATPIPDLVCPWRTQPIQAPIEHLILDPSKQPGQHLRRSSFQQLLDFRASISLITLQEEFNRWCEARWWLEYDRLKPHARKRPAGKPQDLVKKLDPIAAEDLIKEINAISQSFVKEQWSPWDNAIKDRLRKMAADLTPEIDGVWSLFSSHCITEHRSADCGSGRYAKASAEREAVEIRSHGIEAVVRTEWYRDRYPDDPHWKTSDLRDFCVYARCSPLDVQIIKRKPGMDLRTLVKWCWGNSVDPRVYYPFLEHGFEEMNGLDYFGNEVKRD